MDIVIKKLSPDLLTLGMERFIELLSDLPEEYWNAENFLKPLNGKFQISCAAYIQDKLVAYIISSIKEPLTAHIHKFMVDKDFRGMRIGKQIFEFYLEIVQKESLERISLNVYEDNVRAIHFYNQLFFEENSRRIDTNNKKQLLYLTRLL